MLEIKSISKSFGDKVIFENASFSFPSCGIFCINGVSGRGKTTLLKMIAGIEKPDSGSIAKSGSVSLMFQEDRLLPWLTVYENIACVMPKKDKNKRGKIEALLCDLGLCGAEAEMPENLSGGMKRRVAFARALFLSPDILLLDEPFVGLDSDTKSLLVEKIKKYSKQHLVLLVTHSVEEQKLADEVISL